MESDRVDRHSTARVHCTGDLRAKCTRKRGVITLAGRGRSRNENRGFQHHIENPCVRTIPSRTESGDYSAFVASVQVSVRNGEAGKPAPFTRFGSAS